MSKSNYLENALLDHHLGGPDYTRPGTVYVALFSAAPSDAGGGTELSGNGYARKAVTNNATNWPAASGGSKSNGVEIRFDAATGSNWAAATHFGIFDASSGGNLLRWGALSASVTVNVGDDARFAPGALVCTED
jgi:hypothetical protein